MNLPPSEEAVEEDERRRYIARSFSLLASVALARGDAVIAGAATCDGEEEFVLLATELFIPRGVPAGETSVDWMYAMRFIGTGGVDGYYAWK